MGPHSEATVATGKAGSRKMEAVKNFTGLASDSREVKQGYLFAALPGTKANGAEFMADAVKRGAVAILARPDAAGHAKELGVRFIADENPRLGLARAAAEFYGAQPETIAAVTGTNGKTSVAVFLRQIWAVLGKRAASLGTIGVVTPTGEIALKHTTPDPVEIHRLLAQLKHDGIEHLALEASSHGLDQFRLDGANIAAAAFTNLTRDHLDYHADFESYLAAKLRLFNEVVRPDGVAVVNADSDHAGPFIEAATRRGMRLITVGEGNATLNLVCRTPHEGGQTLRVSYEGRTYDFELPLAGSFQASNALIAAALAIGLGENAAEVFTIALPQLKGAPGRLEKVAYAKSGAAIYVDYAHTPDALQTVLTAIRPHVKNRLHVVFGCGGDRDKGKRPLMGKAACQFADTVIVTDDNPRSENPATIRKEALAGCPTAQDIGDRARAIQTAIAGLGEGDTLIIAGKGHESGQTVGAETRPFSDRDEAIAAAGGRMAEGADGALWTSAEAERATLGKASAPFGIRTLSIDTRTLQPGDLFVALKGDNRDGHDFVAAAFDRGASAALVSREIAGVTLKVANTQRGLEDLAHAARARSEAKIIAVTGSAGKTTTKEILRHAFGALGKTHASAASYNNHWGVPLSVASLPREARTAIFEVGMNHFGEIRALVGIVRPHVAIVTTIAPAHLEFFGTCEAIADAKSEIFEGIEEGGTAIVPADSPYAARLIARAGQAGVAHIRTFGRTGKDAKLLAFGDTIEAEILGTKITFGIGAPGEHIATNALAALLAVAVTGGDVAAAARALPNFTALKGRGARFTTAQGIDVIDESYNANPASMAAALAILGAAKPKGRRIAIFGDMLEMGADAAAHHTGLASQIEAAKADLVFANGKNMHALWEVLPPSRRGAYALTSTELAPQILAALKPGDVALVKGSLGSRMAVIVDALKKGSL